MIDAATTVGPVSLTVSSAERVAAFYERHLGMRVVSATGARVTLGAGSRPLLELVEDAKAVRVPGTTGLYHFAVLVPSRLELAHALRRLVDTNTPLQGAADHGVSEALYLTDPDGNGIEIYRDRLRNEWPFVNGLLSMTVDPLDLGGLLSDAPARPASPGLDHATVMGHVHLHVSNIAESEAFYHDVLGFGVTQRYGRAALFVAAGGYHHHIGLNTWAGAGLPPAPEGSLGLRHFVVNTPSGNGAVLRDPSGHSILLAG